MTIQLFSDYHNHPLGHDINRQYCLETLLPWLEHAQKNNLTDIVFTDHDRYHPGIDFAAYNEFLSHVQEGINFRMGIELDNDPETSALGYKWTEANYDKLDFVLGSVHFIGDWAFDHPHYKDEFAKHDINELYVKYFTEIQRIAQDNIYDGLAHLDLIKIFEHRPTQNMTNLYKETLSLIKDNNKTLELSTAGWRKPINEQYPIDEIIQLAYDMNIPITTASDAHAPHDLARDYSRLATIIENIGFTEVAVFSKHNMTLQKF